MLTTKIESVNPSATRPVRPTATRIETIAIRTGTSPAATAPKTSTSTTSAAGRPTPSSPDFRSCCERSLKSWSIVPEPVIVTRKPSRPSLCARTGTPTQATIVRQGWLPQDRASRSVRPIALGCPSELLVERDERELEGVHGGRVRDDVVPGEEHLQQVARQRRVRQRLEERRLHAHQRHGHVDERPADAERAAQAAPELVPRDDVGAAELESAVCRLRQVARPHEVGGDVVPPDRL